MADPCSHTWINPADPPIARAPVSPIIGTGPHEMHDGQTYVCARCGVSLTVDILAMLRAAGVEQDRR